MISAVIGKTVFKVDGGFGTTYVESTDFIIAVDALSEQPQKGDKIFVGETEYEVLAP
jgi:hypothetical protein